VPGARAAEERQATVLICFLLEPVGLCTRETARGHVGIESVGHRTGDSRLQLLGRDVQPTCHVVQKRVPAGASASSATAARRSECRATRARHQREASGAASNPSL
jgi:hypothetical protein